MGIRITTLTENTAGYGLVGEWGLSIFIEADEVKILFDTGLGNAALLNSHVMGIDLSSVDRIVLSHGHIDHTGGLREIVRETGKVEVIAHPDAWKPKYAGTPDVNSYIGIPFQREELESLGAAFSLTMEPVWLSDRILTTGEIPMVTDYEKIDPMLLVKENGHIIPDPLADDLSLVIKTDEGLAVILGCGHRGVVNTLIHSRNLTGEERINTVIGGIHLFNASEERLLRTTADLKEMGVKRLGVSHCTGFYASAWLAQEFGEAFFLNNTGSRVNL